MSPHGALNKIVLRPDHQGAIVEFADVNDAGKAALAVEGLEIIPGRRLGVGSVREMLAMGPEMKEEGKAGVKEQKREKKESVLRPPPAVRRPGLGMPGPGRRGGLGKKVGGGGGVPATEPVKAGAGKNNADFKAMFVKGSGA